MDIYLIRHGITIWNEKGITQGQTNNKLSKNGKLQVVGVAKDLKSVCFDLIFSSPLKRAMQTSKILNKHNKTKIIKDRRLLDIDQGIFSGREYARLSDEEKKLKTLRAKSCKMENIESLYKRLYDFVEYLKKFQYKNVLIVTHGIAATYLEKIIKQEQVDFKKELKLAFNHAQIKRIEI